MSVGWPVNGPAAIVLLDGTVIDVPEGQTFTPDVDISMRTDYIRLYPTGWNPAEVPAKRRGWLRRLLRLP